ncbi:MAG: hypothetical protein H6797_04165 [Candidatus Nomurabacteria bacterium]|nr:MAG: hypothetical protein H6797_04165 [Candidatus Nomurabacteria bacterium]
MQSNNKLRVGIYRDIETPETNIGGAVVAIDNLREKYKNIEIAETNKFVRLTPSGEKSVPTNTVNWLETLNHINIVMTDRRIVDKPGDTPPENFGVIGTTLYRRLRRPFVIVDARFAWDSADRVVTHEVAHVLRIKDSGTYFDKVDHCNHPACIMQPITRPHLVDFCGECSEQLDERFYKLSKKRIRNASMLGRALQNLSDNLVQTTRPFPYPNTIE